MFKYILAYYSSTLHRSYEWNETNVTPRRFPHNGARHVVPRLRQERGHAAALRPVSERVVLQPRVPDRR